MKKCSKCKMEFPRYEFRGHPSTRDRLNSHCRPCERIAVKQWRLNNLDKKTAQEWRYNLKKNYGITPTEYLILLGQQMGVCAICKTKCISGRKLAVDHCHDTNRVRGLLCCNCNRGIGLLKHNVNILTAALDYIMDRRNV